MRWTYKADAEQMSNYCLFPKAAFCYEVTAVEDKETGSKRDMALLSLKCVDADEGFKDYIGKQPSGRLNVIKIPEGEPGHGMALQFLSALGWPHDGNLDFDTEEFVGETFWAETEVEDYTYEDDQGQEQTKIKNTYAPISSDDESPEGGAEGDPPPADEEQPEAQPDEDAGDTEGDPEPEPEPAAPPQRTASPKPKAHPQSRRPAPIKKKGHPGVKAAAAGAGKNAKKVRTKPKRRGFKK